MDLEGLRTRTQARQGGVQIVQGGLDGGHGRIGQRRGVDLGTGGQSDRGAGQAQIFCSNGDGVGAISVRQSRDRGGAVLDEIGAIELSVGHNGADLVAQRREVFVQGIAGRRVQRRIGRGQGFLFHLHQEIRDRLAGGQGHVRGGRRQVQRLIDGLVARHVGTHRLGDSEHAAIVLGRADSQASVDALLNLLQIFVGLVQILQGDHCARVGIDRRHFLAPSSSVSTVETRFLRAKAPVTAPFSMKPSPNLGVNYRK
ncbi:hypothetical protein OCEANICA350_11279 [Oceanicaulis sp. 350]|nr:hypothetical protein OCEANICA350_11279 [Oceanicaulis sp. 350]